MEGAGKGNGDSKQEANIRQIHSSPLGCMYIVCLVSAVCLFRCSLHTCVGNVSNAVVNNASYLCIYLKNGVDV